MTGVNTWLDDRPPSTAATWRAVAMPREHGGWGLTLEPVLLGLAVAWSFPGLLIGVAAFGAFLARTPLKFVAVDVRRHRWRERSTLASRIAGAELTVVAAAVAVAVAIAGARWLAPIAVAAPLVAIEAWYDVRSRSRRLVPELCGAIGIAATAAAIVLADGDDAPLAAALWLVLAARSVGSIPYVRTQIARMHRRVTSARGSDLAQLATVAVGILAVAVDARVLAGLGSIVVIAALQVWWSRRPAPPIKVIGVQQMGLGVAVVAATAVGVHLA